jgi:autotransporter-associated beta strand protein
MVTITAGTHSITSDLILSTSADVAPAGGAKLTILGNIAGSGALLLTGSGSLELGGSNDYVGGTVVTAGTLYVSNSSALPGGSSLTVGTGVGAFGSPVVPAEMSLASAPVAVPEPGTLVLLLVAGVGLCLWRGRFRNWKPDSSR